MPGLSGWLLIFTIPFATKIVYSDSVNCPERSVYDLHDIPSLTVDSKKNGVVEIECGKAGEDMTGISRSCSEETTKMEECGLEGKSKQCGVKCKCNDLEEKLQCMCVPITACIGGVKTVIGCVKTKSRTADVYDPAEES